MNEISFDMIGGTPVVYVKIWSPKKNIYRSMFLTLDTGAAITTISKDILHILGYDTESSNKNRITTASGIEYVSEVTLDRLMLAEFELANVKTYAHTFPQECFSDGVIGINVLSNFDLSISFKRRILGLTPVN